MCCMLTARSLLAGSYVFLYGLATTLFLYLPGLLKSHYSQREHYCIHVQRLYNLIPNHCLTYIFLHLKHPQKEQKLEEIFSVKSDFNQLLTSKKYGNNAGMKTHKNTILWWNNGRKEKQDSLLQRRNSGANMV